MKNTKAFWNKTASSYDKVEEKDRVVYERILTEMKSYLKPDFHLLDIGCGTGALHDQLSSLVEHIDGIDYSENMIQIAKEKASIKRLANVSYSCGTLAENSAIDKSYDIVTAFYILHLFENLESDLRLIKNHLSEHGYFISVTPCMKDSGLIGAMLGLSGAVGLIPKINRYTQHDLTKQFEECGFKIIDVRESTHEYMIIACAFVD